MKVFARSSRAAAAATALVLASACASGAPAGRPNGRGPQPSQNRSRFPRGNPAADKGWTISTREQVDAWLHGFAMVMKDTTHVPIFAPGYRQNIEALEKQRNVSSALTANADRLGARFAVEPTLVNAQFVPMYFSSFADLMAAGREFLNANGDPRSTTDPVASNRIALFAAYFPNASDREWLQVFLTSLQDDYDKFYHAYWTEQQTRLTPVVSAVSSRWNASWYPALRTYLSNTQQGSGEVLLSLPLAGEGRTESQSGITASAITLPASADSADDALYAFAHEAVQQITNAAIADNASGGISGFQRRENAFDLYGASAAVRGGALLLQRLMPGAVPGYMSYYMRVAGAAVPAGDATPAFEKEFALPKGIVDGINRQLTEVLGVP